MQDDLVARHVIRDCHDFSYPDKKGKKKYDDGIYYAFDDNFQGSIPLFLDQHGGTYDDTCAMTHKIGSTHFILLLTEIDIVVGPCKPEIIVQIQQHQKQHLYYLCEVPSTAGLNDYNTVVMDAIPYSPCRQNHWLVYNYPMDNIIDDGDTTQITASQTTGERERMLGYPNRYFQDPGG